MRLVRLGSTSTCMRLLAVGVLLALTVACDFPAPTPARTPTAVAPQPPRIIRHLPQRGEEHPVEAPLEITFDQPMDPGSVRSAWSISPTIEGTLTWRDSTLVFSPIDPGFARDTLFRATIGTAARSAAGIALVEPLVVEFRTAGHLRVLSVQPSPGAEGIAPDAAVTVVFNRPVVPLSALAEVAQLVPLKFGPAVLGTGEWLNTSVFVFRPEAGFAPGTTYRAVVEPERLAEVSDAAMPEAFEWSFSIGHPAVSQVTSSDTLPYIGPSPTISITFNMHMNQRSAEQLFSLRPLAEHQPIPVSFHWDGPTMQVKPVGSLSLDTEFTLSVGAGAQAAAGGEGMAERFEWTFATVERPRVLWTVPRSGATQVDPFSSLRVKFSSPIARDTLLPHLVIEPKPTDVYTTWVEADTEVYVSFGARPSTTYRFLFDSNIRGRFGHRLEAPFNLSFTTAALPPSTYIPPGRVGTYNAYATTAVLVQHRNVSELNLSLYQLDRADFVQLNGSDAWRIWEDYRPRPERLIRKWTAKVDDELDAYVSTDIALSDDMTSPLRPGFYYLEVRAPGVSETVRHMLVVSYANVILKVTQDEALAWVTDLANGKPVPGLDIALFGPGGQILASGRTDNDGVFLSALSPGLASDPWANVLALAGPDESPCASSTGWASGIEPWQFDLPSEPSLARYRAYFYSDRAIYRPGQRVYFKGILRADDDGLYNLPSDVSIPVTIYDDYGNEIYQADLPVNDMGTVNGEFRLSSEASLGFYGISAQIGDRSFGTSFRVAEYRKPEYVVELSTDAHEYVQGDEISVTMSASYYFGGPVAHASVTWRLMSQDHYFQLPENGKPTSLGGPHYDFTDCDYERRGQQTAFGELVTTGSGTTDGDGRLTLTLPADVGLHKNSQVFTIEASVVDQSNQEVSGRTSAIVHKAELYVGLAPAEYVSQVGKSSTVHLIAVTPQGETRAGVPISITFSHLKWYNVQKQADDGRFYWEWTVEETPTFTASVTTDLTGRAQVAFDAPSGGSYRARASAFDSRQNTVYASTYVWVSSGSYVAWQQQNNDRIELITDQRAYTPGQTARLLVPSPFQGDVEALVTVERGHIYSYRRVTLKSNSDQIEIPIEPQHAPNAYACVILVDGMATEGSVPAFRVGYAELNVSTRERELAVVITPDRTTSYLPGDRAAFDVQVTDYTGRPVQAELSLQLVDAAVLALVDESAGGVLNHFYRERGLGVRTGATLSISVDRYRLQAKPPEGKGGSGGPGEQDSIRKRFEDTAYWNAVVRTDASGRATVSTELPDNLTTWRVSARAVTKDTLVGDGAVDIVTSKALLIRPVSPRFLVHGDQLQVAAIVHNSTDQPITVDLSLDAAGLDVTEPDRRVYVAAHEEQRAEWQAMVTGNDTAALTWKGSGAGLTDAVELTLPIHHYTTPEIVATSGRISQAEPRVERIILPDGIDTTEGELTIELNPSLAAGMRSGITYLEQYPFHCIEQTVSRFLPNVVMYRALQQLDVHDSELEARLPQFVSEGLQRLYALQHYDGGWGWWLADSSHPFMTAYVLLGMNEAQRAGYAVNQQVMNRAAEYLQGTLGAKDSVSDADHDVRAFVLYVLAEHGEGDLGRTVALFENRDSLDTYGRAFLLLALRRLEPEQPSRASTLVSELTTAAIQSATGAHWEEQVTDYHTMSTDTRSTAIVLLSLLQTIPEDPLVANAVRWLMNTRQEGRWETTQETAWSILALTDFLVASGELEGDYDYRVALNSELIEQKTVTVQDVEQTQTLLVQMSDLLLTTANEVLLERVKTSADQTGKGQLYYSMHLRYFLPAENVEAISRGIYVSRQYELLEAAGQPIDSAAAGDVIRVKLTLLAPNDLHYLVVEDPLPAGCEALDVSLRTTSGVYEGAQLSRETQVSPYWCCFTETELRDEKAVLFATYLSKGAYEYSYLIRANVPGSFLTRPTQAYEMYFPEVFGRSDGGVFVIED